MIKKMIGLTFVLAVLLTGCYTSFDAIDAERQQASEAEYYNDNEAEMAEPAEEYSVEESDGDTYVYNYYSDSPYIIYADPFYFPRYAYYDYWRPYYYSYYYPFYSPYYYPYYYGWNWYYPGSYGYYNYYGSYYNSYYYSPSVYKNRTNYFASRNRNTGGRGYQRDSYGSSYTDRPESGRTRDAVNLNDLHSGRNISGTGTARGTSENGVKSGSTIAGNNRNSEVINTRNGKEKSVRPTIEKGIDRGNEVSKKVVANSSNKENNGKPIAAASRQSVQKKAAPTYKSGQNSTRTYRNYNKSKSGNYTGRTYRSGENSKYTPPKSSNSSRKSYTPKSNSSSNSGRSKSYTPPKSNSSGRSYTPPKSSNSGRSYSPPKSSSSRRSYSPPKSSSSGSYSAPRSSGSSSRSSGSSSGRSSSGSRRRR